MHTLFCGVTLSGKTTLARAIAQEQAKKGVPLIVFDPVGTSTANGNWPESAIVISDLGEFLEYMAHPDVHSASVYIDEAANVFNARMPENCLLLTQGRHRGLQINMIAQRPKMVLPNARTQAARTYMFRLATEDAREVFADAGHNSKQFDLNLDTGDFYVLHSGSRRVERGNVFNLIKPKGKAP